MSSGRGPGPATVPPSSSTLPRWLKRALRAPNFLYEHGAGQLLGHRFLQLTHVGRRSGRTFRTVLEVIRYDPETGEATVLSGFGPQADWLRNLQAAGAAEVSFGAGPRRAAYRLLSFEEAERALAEYERRNWLMVPVVRRVLSRLVGWRYDGSADARRRAVQQLPMVAFRPEVVSDGRTVAAQMRQSEG